MFKFGFGSKTIQFENGLYKGIITNGKKSGKGKMIYLNGDIYEGEWKDDKRSGNGKLRFENGDVYKGEWKDDKRSGNGTMNIVYGREVYKGEWKDDQKSGYGKFKNMEKDVYEGNWMNDKKNGYGKEKYSDSFQKSSYEGNWKDDKKSGYGKMIYGDGNVYEGNYKDDMMNGYGKLIYKNGDIYEGNFYDSYKFGHGKMIYGNGDVYEGNFKKNKRNGYGKMIYLNGNVDEGLWKNDKMLSKEFGSRHRLNKLNKLNSSNNNNLTKWMNLCKKSINNISNIEYEELCSYIQSINPNFIKLEKSISSLRKMCGILSADFELQRMCDKYDDIEEEIDKLSINDKGHIIDLLKMVGIDVIGDDSDDMDEKNDMDEKLKSTLINYCRKNTLECKNDDDFGLNKISKYNSNQIYRDSNGYCYSYEDVKNLKWSESLINNEPINNEYSRTPYSEDEMARIADFIVYNKDVHVQENIHSFVKSVNTDPEVIKYVDYLDRIETEYPYDALDNFFLLSVSELNDIIELVNSENNLNILKIVIGNKEDLISIYNKFFENIFKNYGISIWTLIYEKYMNYSNSNSIIGSRIKRLKNIDLNIRVYKELESIHKDHSDMDVSTSVFIGNKYSTMPEVHNLKMKIEYLKYRLLYIKKSDNNGLLLLEKLIKDILDGKYDNNEDLYKKMIEVSGVYFHLVDESGIEKDENLPMMLRNMNNYFSFFINSNILLFNKYLEESKNLLCLNAKFRSVYNDLVEVDRKMYEKTLELLTNTITDLLPEICKIVVSNGIESDKDQQIFIKEYLLNDEKSKLKDLITKLVLLRKSVYNEEYSLNRIIDYIISEILLFDNCSEYIE